MFNRVIFKIDSNIRTMEKIVVKKFFYHIALVSEANDEVIDAVIGIELHDVPK